MIYNRRPQRLEAFRVNSVDWKAETGYAVTYDDGSIQVISPRGNVPMVGDYWDALHGHQSAEDFERNYEKCAHSHEIVLPRIS